MIANRGCYSYLYLGLPGDIRHLIILESNFRKIVKLRLRKLLHWQYLNWRKRCTQRYIKVGEENSKKIQAMASERHRINFIASLQLPDGTSRSNHDILAATFWFAFRNIMGVAKGIV